MHGGWLAAILNLLGLGASGATAVTGGKVCGTFAAAGYVAGTFAAHARVAGTFGVEEC